MNAKISWTTWNPTVVFCSTGEVRLIPERLGQPLRWRKSRRVFVNSDLFHEALPFSQIAAVLGIVASTPRHDYQVLTKRASRMVEFFQWLAERAAGANERYRHGEDYQIGFRARQALRDQGHAEHTEPPPPTEMVRGLYDIAEPILKPHLSKRLPVHHWSYWPLKNLSLGVSVEDQATADERIPLLLQTPAAVRFISYEPLGPLKLDADEATGLHALGCGNEPNCDCGTPRLNWVVAGGKSGPNARPSHSDWFRQIRDQCQAAGVPFHFKGWGEWAPVGSMPKSTACVVAPDGRWAKYPVGAENSELLSRGVSMYRVGKLAAGRLLDGKLWDQFPDDRSLLCWQDAKGCAPSLTGLSPEAAIRKIRGHVDPFTMDMERDVPDGDGVER